MADVHLADPPRSISAYVTAPRLPPDTLLIGNVPFVPNVLKISITCSVYRVPACSRVESDGP